MGIAGDEGGSSGSGFLTGAVTPSTCGPAPWAERCLVFDAWRSFEQPSCHLEAKHHLQFGRVMKDDKPKRQFVSIEGTYIAERQHSRPQAF